jgi:hypothetical protein
MDTDTPYNPFLPALDFDEHSSSSSSPLDSSTPSSLSLVSTPASSIIELPKQVPPRDPHVIPVFNDETLTNPGEPILYLPPFLSSLPQTLSSPNPTSSSGRVPKGTVAHLPDIDHPSLSLHKALHKFTPITENYAAVSYAEAFNWDELDLPEEDEHEWYCVAFRSLRRRGSENGRQSPCLCPTTCVLTNPLALYEADRAAHEEAVRNGGVCLVIIFPTCDRLTFFFTFEAYLVLVRDSQPGYGPQPSYLRVAISCPRDCCELAPTPHTRDAPCSSILRGL